MRTIIVIFLTFLHFSINAQVEISGRVLDENNQVIPGANVYLEGTYDGSTTDSEGFFKFQTSETDSKVLVVSFLSYETFRELIVVSQFKNQVIQLKESVNALDAVVVSAGTFEAGDKARVSVLKPLDIVTTAGAAGNIIGALNTLPGTQTVGENGRLFVRGGEADETQTFVDGLRVAQPYGAAANNLPTRSRFSPFLFNGITFSTGGYSAEYGEALSSVLTLQTIDEPVQNQTDISFMTVGLGLGNTQKWEKQSLTFNANYVNLEPYQRVVPQAVDWNKPFESLGGEMVYRYEFKNGLLKAYGAFDVAKLDVNQEDINQPEKVRFKLQNNNFYGNVSYKGIFGHQWNLHTGLSFGTASNDIRIDNRLIENLQNALHFKFKIHKKLTEKIKITGGMDYFSTFYEEEFKGFSNVPFQVGYDHHLIATFLESDVFFSKKWAMKVGVRASQNGLLNEFHASPRASFAYKVSKNGQFSAAYGSFVQTPRADFIKFSDDLHAEKAQHFILNYQYNQDGRLFRAEIYRKVYDNLVKFNTPTPQFDAQYSNDGFGYAQGLDLFWRDNKTVKSLEYWFSYSFIDTQRDYLNFPEQVTPSFVADHTASLVAKYWIDDWKSQVGFSYTINSGRPYNNPNQTEFMNGKTKAFQDLSFNWAYLLSQQKILYFSISNILGTDNIFGYQYAQNPDLNGQFPRRAIGQPASRFLFVGFFWTISDNKKTNQLNQM